MLTKCTRYIEPKVVQEYFSNKKFKFLLPLLELSLSDIKKIYCCIDEKALADLVSYALDWKMKDYWQSLSIEWIECGIVLNESLMMKLKKIPGDKGYSQKLRHKVQRILNKNQR